MTTEEKIALHYKVIADTAHKVEKVSEELSSLYKEDFFRKDRVDLRKRHLLKYFNELNELLQSI